MLNEPAMLVSSAENGCHFKSISVTSWNKDPVSSLNLNQSSWSHQVFASNHPIVDFRKFDWHSNG